MLHLYILLRLYILKKKMIKEILIVENKYKKNKRNSSNIWVFNSLTTSGLTPTTWQLYRIREPGFPAVIYDPLISSITQ